MRKAEGDVRGSWWERIKKIPHIKTNVAVWVGLVALGRARHIEGARDIGPRPMDFFNHSGNILLSVNIALMASAAIYLSQKQEIETHTKDIRRRILATSVAAGVVVNAIVETKIGLDMPLVSDMFGENHRLQVLPVVGDAFKESTPDPVDFIYGVGGAMVGGTMAASMLPRQQYDVAGLSSHAAEG